MRKLTFNKFERVAGLFVLFAIIGSLLTAFSVAIKQGWFERKVFYTTVFEDAEGLHQGTAVQMAGLKAGAVESVELQPNNKVRVRFYVLGKFEERIHQDSSVQLIRPFIIGERALDVTVGSEKSPVRLAQSEIPSAEAFDFMSMLNGKNINQNLVKISGLLENIKVVMQAFGKKGRAESVVRIFDRLDPLIKNLNGMSMEVIKLSQQVTYDDGVQKLIANLAVTTNEINRILPELNKQNPTLAKDLGTMMQNLAFITKAVSPAVKAVEADLPGSSLRLIEVLNETVVVLKAMEKSFFMQGNVREVKEEEASRRVPASAPAN